MDKVILTELIVYCAVMLLLGYYFSRKKLTQSDFLLGGKKLPGWALAFSERATGSVLAVARLDGFYVCKRPFCHLGLYWHCG